MPRLTNLTKNEAAFMDMISYSEGTYQHGDDGYNEIVGGQFFNGYDDHPNILVDLGNGLKSTAAGRYQLLHKYYVWYKAHIPVHDFSPESQDIICLQQIMESRARDVINFGNFDQAVYLCAHIWASLPGAGYGQHENRIEALRDFYTRVGGTIV